MNPALPAPNAECDPKSPKQGTSPAFDNRRHDLDALRAGAMLLGIAYHAALAYADGMGWMVQDINRDKAMYLFQAFVHGFRMPLFFVLSGFFTALLWRKRGLKALLGNRAKRILIPCLLGLFTVVPAMGWAVTYAGKTGNKPKAGIVAGEAVDLWTAVSAGNTGVVAQILAGGGKTNLNAQSKDIGMTPLSMAGLMGHTPVVEQLLAAGADVNAPNKDGRNALSAAAFLGRTNIVALLLSHGIDIRAKSNEGETALDAIKTDWGTTEYIAGLFGLSLDRTNVEAGRTWIRGRFAELGFTDAPKERGSQMGATVAGLINTPVFIVIWFLWFLCWFLAVFSIYAWVARACGWKSAPRWLLLSPGGFAVWVLLTMVPQWFMYFSDGNFGPDTSMGILPMPHVFVYYGLFFFFGVLYFDINDDGVLGRRWRWTLPVTVGLLLPVAAEIASGNLGFRESIVPRSWYHPMATALESLYAWSMSIACMGMFRSLLTRESRVIRYLSDSAYWLYLGHLPLVIAAQAYIQKWPVPALVKCLGITVVITSFLLFTYETVVRYTPIGTLLNGKRNRNRHPGNPGAMTPPALPGARPAA